MNGRMQTSTTKEGTTTMTDAMTLATLIAEAESGLQAAIRWAATTDLHAPLAMKVNQPEAAPSAGSGACRCRGQAPRAAGQRLIPSRGALIEEGAICDICHKEVGRWAVRRRTLRRTYSSSDRNLKLSAIDSQRSSGGSSPAHEIR